MTHSIPSPALGGAPATVLVLGRHRVADGERADFLARVRAAVGALSAQPGFLRASLGQSTDDPSLLVLRTEWAGVGAYRRALSSFDVKLHAVPLLSLAIDEPSAYELVLDWADGAEAEGSSGLAADAGDVGLGEAAGPGVPAVGG